ncbi:hypothetical protein [Bordetella sp. FB-8]|uniref:hypothetical protein n=1 Tax=Bordetella sp. FB-8 TaxID=1159870 RepID=UPI000379B2FF|nr:hypothetical protein [Bordetella sp. FB-8]
MTALKSLRHAVQDASEMGRRAQMRAALPYLDDLVKRGTTYEILVSELSKLAMPVRVESLRMALYRWRKLNRTNAAEAADHTPAIPRPLQGQQQAAAVGALTSGGSRPTAVGIPPGVPVREYLRQLRNTPVDPDEEARRDREWRKAQTVRNNGEK